MDYFVRKKYLFSVEPPLDPSTMNGLFCGRVFCSFAASSPRDPRAGGEAWNSLMAALSIPPCPRRGRNRCTCRQCWAGGRARRGCPSDHDPQRSSGMSMNLCCILLPIPVSYSRGATGPRQSLLLLPLLPTPAHALLLQLSGAPGLVLVRSWQPPIGPFS